MSNAADLPAESGTRRARLPQLWPTSLATRTLMTLLFGLILVQGAGLTIHALDRLELQRVRDMREVGRITSSIYRSVVATSPLERAQSLRELELPAGASAHVANAPPTEPADLTPPATVAMIRLGMQGVPLRPANRPRDVMVRGAPGSGRFTVGVEFPDLGWLDVSIRVPPPRPWHSPTFLIAFALMTIAAAALSAWAVRRLIGPVATLAEQAERLGRDVNAPPLPEDGPAEVARAARAFNTMAQRIRRFVQDRTFLLTAIGHDLRTPITRLKLRAEFIEDDEQRGKFLADLDELDTMVSATLAFGRDVAGGEPLCPLDLSVLLRTVLDEVADARPEGAEGLAYDGPAHLTVSARPVALKRALSNLVSNAVKYGGGVTIRVQAEAPEQVMVLIEDNGEGIPAAELERVFDPFYRLEGSRNRETGGTGLGLPIARNILRAHGGDVVLTNRAQGGVRAIVSLPV